MTSNSDRMGLRHPPMVFTEQGVAMLSSILNSDRAVQVNIAIMRAFVNMRRIAATNDEFNKKLAAIENKLGDHDGHFKQVFAAIRAMTAPKSNQNRSDILIRRKIQRDETPDTRNFDSDLFGSFNCVGCCWTGTFRGVIYY